MYCMVLHSDPASCYATICFHTSLANTPNCCLMCWHGPQNHWLFILTDTLAVCKVHLLIIDNVFLFTSQTVLFMFLKSLVVITPIHVIHQCCPALMLLVLLLLWVRSWQCISDLTTTSNLMLLSALCWQVLWVRVFRWMPMCSSLQMVVWLGMRYVVFCSVKAKLTLFSNTFYHISLLVIIY